MSPGSCPRGGTLGRWGCPGGQKNSNMVIWHIKSTGMTSRTEYSFAVAGVMTQGWDLGLLGGSKTSAGGFAMAPH